MEQIYNPYLTLTEHIPDGEPHLFGDRVYIYGSHDKANGRNYCEDHYCVWSAPKDNLRDWRCEGTSYLRSQDPSNSDDLMQLWAPDVTQGPDGRYYMYYCFSFYPEIGVAVSEKPEGPFEFYGHVKYPESMYGGKTLGEYMPFDPAIFTDDDNRVYLYYGFCPAGEKEMEIPKLTEEEIAALPKNVAKIMKAMSHIQFGENSMVAELMPDMITLKEEPHPLIPGGHHTKGTGFEGHGFFEASSIRKINGTYYFVYSSQLSHELCYATSAYPDRDFVYGGTIISNGDIGLDGRENPVYTLGNNHGGILQIEDDFYIFYHRQTNGTEASRQGCAEKIEILPDGSIEQVEITSCGLNGGPLQATGSYPAAIACHLTDPSTRNSINYMDPVMKEQIRVTEQQNQVYVTGIKDGSIVGFKYFEFKGEKQLLLELRGSFTGEVIISADEAKETILGYTELKQEWLSWSIVTIPLHVSEGKHALYLNFNGNGSLDLKNIIFVQG